VLIIERSIVAMNDSLWLFLDYFGTLAFAISGALLAVRHDLDLLGIIILAVATGVGGGMVRDTLLGAHPLGVFDNEMYLLVCFLGALLVFWAAPRVERRGELLLWADAIGLGVFAAIGCTKGADYGLGSVGVVMMGALTATGGGVVRDVLVRRIPAVIHTDFYASAAILGGILHEVLRYNGVDRSHRLLWTTIAVVVLRGIAMRYEFHLPKARNYNKNS
jgi:uncharacterized membrane protein YeiH